LAKFGGWKIGHAPFSCHFTVTVFHGAFMFDWRLSTGRVDFSVILAQFLPGNFLIFDITVFSTQKCFKIPRLFWPKIPQIGCRLEFTNCWAWVRPEPVQINNNNNNKCNKMQISWITSSTVTNNSNRFTVIRHRQISWTTWRPGSIFWPPHRISILCSMWGRWGRQISIFRQVRIFVIYWKWKSIIWVARNDFFEVSRNFPKKTYIQYETWSNFHLYFSELRLLRLMFQWILFILYFSRELRKHLRILVFSMKHRKIRFL